MTHSYVIEIKNLYIIVCNRDKKTVYNWYAINIWTTLVHVGRDKNTDSYIIKWNNINNNSSKNNNNNNNNTDNGVYKICIYVIGNMWTRFYDTNKRNKQAQLKSLII